MPLNNRISFVTVQFQLVVLHIRGKVLPDDEHSCAGVTAGSQPVSFGGRHLITGGHVHEVASRLIGVVGIIRFSAKQFIS